jgi:hypothetical protein
MKELQFSPVSDRPIRMVWSPSEIVEVFVPLAVVVVPPPNRDKTREVAVVMVPM